MSDTGVQRNDGDEMRGEAEMQQASEVARDPVCGVTVDRRHAQRSELRSRYSDQDYLFCGRGCKLDFDEDPARFLDPNYIPTM